MKHLRVWTAEECYTSDAIGNLITAHCQGIISRHCSYCKSMFAILQAHDDYVREHQMLDAALDEYFAKVLEQEVREGDYTYLLELEQENSLFDVVDDEEWICDWQLEDIWGEDDLEFQQYLDYKTERTDYDL